MQIFLLSLWGHLGTVGTDLMKTAGFVLTESTDAPESMCQVMTNRENKLVIVNYSDHPLLARLHTPPTALLSGPSISIVRDHPPPTPIKDREVEQVSLSHNLLSKSDLQGGDSLQVK